jgi:hypothetical protein
MATAQKLPSTAFKKGQPGGPGRPLGSRNKLSETMLALLAADAAENGAEVIARVRREKPHVWLQCMVALLPRQLHVERRDLSELTDSELEQLERLLARERAKTIDALAEKTSASSPAIVNDSELCKE